MLKKKKKREVRPPSGKLFGNDMFLYSFFFLVRFVFLFFLFFFLPSSQTFLSSFSQTLFELHKL